MASKSTIGELSVLRPCSLHIKWSMIVVFICIAPSTFSQSKDAIAKIDSIRNSMRQLAVQNELAQVADYYASDAVVNGFDGCLDGIEAILKYWKNIKGEGVDWKWRNLEYSGNDQYVTQTGISALTLRYGEREITFPSTFTVIWERQSDGGYKIISDFYRVDEQPDPMEITRDSVFIALEKDTIFGVFFRPREMNHQIIPAVLCLQGGGDVGLSNYLFEAQFFAENGLAALVCDKSGAGFSKGESSWVSQTFEQKTREYFQLIRWLQEHPGIAASKIGVHGLSEGGRLALDLAIKHPDDIAFVNAVSAPIESFKQNQLFAIYNLLISRNFDFSVIVETLSIWNQYFDEIAKGEVSKEVVQRADELRNETTGLYLPPSSTELPQRPQSDDIHYSLHNLLSNIHCPVLFQYGEEDTRVNTSKSLSLIPDGSHFSVINYADTDHNMNLSTGHLNTNFLKDKELWLKSINMN